MRLENPKVIAAGDVLRGAIAHCHVVHRHVVPRRPKHVLARPDVGRRPACPLRELAALCLILRESRVPRIGLVARSERGDTACCTYAGELVAVAHWRKKRSITAILTKTFPRPKIYSRSSDWSGRRQDSQDQVLCMRGGARDPRRRA